MFSQNSTPKVSVLMTDVSLVPLPGLTLSLQSSINGAGFSGISRAVTEIGFGWYSIQLTTADTGTVGDLILRISAVDAIDSNIINQIEVGVWNEPIESGTYPAGSAGAIIEETQITANNTLALTV